MSPVKIIKPPKKIKVINRTYTLKFSKTAWANITWSGDKIIAKGWTDHENLNIIIWPDLDPDVLAEVLMHEVEHCITSVTGVANDLDDGKITEEQLVTRMAPVRLQVYRDNPKLVRFLETHVK